MNSIERILQEYRNADFDLRLGFFLDHPELRAAFIHIEMNEMPRPTGHRAPIRAFAAQRPSYASCVAGCLQMLRRSLTRT
jgi:hypothetical protein